MSAALVKGQNGPLPVTDVVVSVEVAASSDVSALLVTERGKVRTDADFVFYNQPNGPGVRLQPGAPNQPATLAISLNHVPADIAQVRAVITLADPNGRFGRLPAPTAVVADHSGNRLYEYRIEGLSSESVVIALELYRRQGGWKVRAVGQGYAGGFADLVTDHGVRVDDAPQPNPAPQQPLPASTQPRQSVQQPAPATPTQNYAAPPPPPQYPSYPPPVPEPRTNYTPPTYPPAPQAYSQPTPPTGEVSLAKGRPVSLDKGQRVTLRKEGGVALTFIRMGLGWDPVKRRGGFFGSRTLEIDLDAWVAMFADTNLVDIAYYGQLSSKDGSIRHQGDNLTGEGEGDDEVILVDLTRIPAHVTTLLFVVTSYQGHTFEQIANAFCRLVDATTDAELARYSLTGGMPFTAITMAKVYRAGTDWKLQALGDGFQAKHPGEAVGQLGRFL
ncbi:stress response protein SCP2 [Nocardia tenerifensis]|uniref:Stress response protein SCP2 n=1 Tax=Nocardia tenerifensis TaxID=228006 RepID=A0A318K534_9NOCA|nr:TerD family protein [Nocardia tenerifensis]PXX58083.1 stress response protein SCP2 [Nocardia tenerifensis]